MKESTIDRIISIVRHYIIEDGMSVSAAPTNSTNPPGQINIAGLPPDSPPVDLRKGRRRNWNPFFKNLAKMQRRKPPQ
jgi:hypothetical protein